MIDQEIEINEIENEDIKATDEADPDHGKIVGVIEGKIGHTLRIIVITDFRTRGSCPRFLLSYQSKILLHTFL